MKNEKIKLKQCIIAIDKFQDFLEQNFDKIKNKEMLRQIHFQKLYETNEMLKEAYNNC